ncbi:hypothetical protein V1358_14510 [Pseudoalteromonas sp. YIC-656]|uniref:hypothetical protein n=1 Tax=Pseudoalteromonas pernae TaxID=3118054 RepID=UPI0032426CF7
MKRFNCKKLIRVLGVTLISAATLYGFSTAPVHASFFPQKLEQACMAEQAGFDLNCTAKDIRVTSVDNIRNLDGSPAVSCQLGSSVSFKADVSITTTANERYDYSVYLPEGNWSAQDSNPDNTCSILLGQNNGPGVDLEEGQDQCADISKAAGFDETHVYVGEEITLFCRDDDNSGYVDFNYCAAWHNKDGADCSEDDPAAPGTPSKCRCESFDIDIFIKPSAPVITKTLESASSTATEPSGSFTYSVSFTNPNSGASIFLGSLEDVIDQGGDDSFETTLDLWGATTSAGTADGVYLTNSTCSQPANGGEVLGGASYSCQFTVTIVDSDLPDDQTPELYDDTVRLTLTDSNGDGIEALAACPGNVSQSFGDHCSNEKRVTLTNVAPSISVLKEANVSQVPESGGDVTYTITVTNTSPKWDSPITITSLMDDVFGDLTTLMDSDCAIGAQLDFEGFYQCSFTQWIAADMAGSHTNVVTAKGTDNEGDEATGSESETVMISNVLSNITLEKVADPIEVPETGDDPSQTRSVEYTFTFGVDGSGVDNVTFKELLDDMFGDLTDECKVDTKNGMPFGPVDLLDFVLMPGETASCNISRDLTGNSGEVHVNVATINGIDDDNDPVTQMDDASVTFIPAAPAADVKFGAGLLAVVELTNTGIENVTLTSMLFDGFDVFAEEETSPDLTVDGFKLINSGGSYENQNYPACNQGQLLTYNGSPGSTYSCAFTIEYRPGLDSVAAINQLNELIITLEDDEGDATINKVDIQVYGFGN